MPAINSLASGAYSAAGTWVGGVPPAAPNWPDIQNLHTVTLDQSIDVGPDDGVNPAIKIRSGGTLQVIGGAGANYTITCQGTLTVDQGGTFKIGDVGAGNEIPFGRLITIVTNKSAALASPKYGIDITGTCTFQAWKPTPWMTTMTVPAAIGDSHIHVANVGDWHNGDVIAIAPTNRPPANTGLGLQDEIRVIDHFVGNEIHLTVPLTYAHDAVVGTIDTEVINLSRPILITSFNQAYHGWTYFLNNSFVNWDGVESYHMGTTAGNKWAWSFNTIANVAYLDGCSIRETESYAIVTNASNKYEIRELVMASVTRTAANVAAISLSDVPDATRVVDKVCIIGAGFASAINGLLLGSGYLSPISNIYISGLGSNGGQTGAFNTNNNVWNRVNPKYGPMVLHSNSACGVYCSNSYGSWLEGFKIYRNNYATLFWYCGYYNQFINFEMFGNANNFSLGSGGSFLNTLFKDFTINGDTTYASTNAFYGQAGTSWQSECQMHNIVCSVVSGIKTACAVDFSHNGGYFTDDRVSLHNCIFADLPAGAGGWVGNGATQSDTFYFRSEDHNQIPGKMKTYVLTGWIETDTVIKNVGTVQSVRLTPKAVTSAPPWVTKHKGPLKTVAVQSGSTFTISVKVRESVVGDGTDYNGARIRLMVKKNVRMGYADDTLLQTASIASEGAWETISAAIGPVPLDGVLEFYVDCSGTTGWVNEQNWTAL